jgi:hypothetical protein
MDNEVMKIILTNINSVESVVYDRSLIDNLAFAEIFYGSKRIDYKKVQDFIFKIVTLELDETGKFSKLVLADKEIEQLWLTATFDEQQQLQIKFRAHMGELIMCSFEEKELNRYIDIWKKLWRADSANNQILLDQFGLVTIMRLAAINHQVAKNFLTTLLESIPTPVNEWLANYFKYKKINNFSYMVKSIKSNLLSIDITVQNKLKNIIKVIAYHPDLELTIVTPYINKFFPDENLPYEKKALYITNYVKLVIP